MKLKTIKKIFIQSYYLQKGCDDFLFDLLNTDLNLKNRCNTIENESDFKKYFLEEDTFFFDTNVLFGKNGKKTKKIYYPNYHFNYIFLLVIFQEKILRNCTILLNNLNLSFESFGEKCYIGFGFLRFRPLWSIYQKLSCINLVLNNTLKTKKTTYQNYIKLLEKYGILFFMIEEILNYKKTKNTNKKINIILNDIFEKNIFEKIEEEKIKKYIKNIFKKKIQKIKFI